MESALKLAQWTVYALAVMIWIGALVFAGYRIKQMGTLKPVRAEVLEAATQSYMSGHYGEDASGWRVKTQSRMYSATAKVRYEYEGREYVTGASHDVGMSWEWLQARLTREWKPGSKIWVHIDPAKPDAPLAGLGFNVNTFTPSIGLALFGLIVWAAGHGLGRLLPMVLRFQQSIPGADRMP